jgi:glutathione peroxidase
MGTVFFKKGGEKLKKDVSTTFYDFKMKDINGDMVDFKTYQDRKVIMVVNVASKWGLTESNYKQMVSMYEDLKHKKFEILAFPCNQFAGQESGSEAEIKKFVAENFNAKFPMFSKI